MKYLFVCVILLFDFGSTVARGQAHYYGSSNGSNGSDSSSGGVSGIINAQGQRNLSNSQAAINMTDVRSNHIDNQLKSANAYWQKRAMGDPYRQQQDAEIEQKRKLDLQRIGSLDLSPDEFDRTTGQIMWLKILVQKPFDPYRTKLDSLFKKRSQDGALDGDDYLLATTALNDWRAAIIKQAHEYPRSILDQMLRFQLKVKRELDDDLG